MIGDILQPTHLLLILAVALIVLGPKRLPEVGKSLGRGLRDFRSALSGDDHEPPRESLHQPEPVSDPATPQPTSEPATAVQPQTETRPATTAQPVDEPQPLSTGAPSDAGERSS